MSPDSPNYICISNPILSIACNRSTEVGLYSWGVYTVLDFSLRNSV